MLKREWPERCRSLFSCLYGSEPRGVVPFFSCLYGSEPRGVVPFFSCLYGSEPRGASIKNTLKRPFLFRVHIYMGVIFPVRAEFHLPRHSAYSPQPFFQEPQPHPLNHTSDGLILKSYVAFRLSAGLGWLIQFPAA